MAVETSLRDGVLVVTVNNPPVNALSAEERAGLIRAIEAAEATDVKAVVIIGARDSFISGADIREFGQPPQPPHLPDVVDAIESCPRPVVAAIAGQALGGGLEIALGCHYRIAVVNAKLGLPEVTLGLVPGAGGTQRLPRLVDPLTAGSIIVSGRPVKAVEALARGLIDKVAASNNLLEEALRFAAELVRTGCGPRRLSQRSAPNLSHYAEDFARLVESTKRQARGAEAPMVALELVKLALTTPFATGLAAEREAFLRLRSSHEARALQHVFFAERAAAKPPEDLAQIREREIARVGVIGAGTMGSGIATCFADAGLPVTVVDASPEALSRGLDRIRQGYLSSADRGRITAAEAAERSSLVRGSVDYADLTDCDLIVEAAFEALDVKREVFGRLEAVAKPGAILATNTSYLDLNEIAAFTRRPADVVGMHYFSPANVMRLLEIVRGRETAPDVIVTALAIAKRTGKIPVLAGVCHGFIGNRMLKSYVREAGLLLVEGARPDQVDAALTAFGMAMGPFAVADLSGIDIGYKARRELPSGAGEPLATLVHDRLAEAGHLGRKTGRGFYIYGEKGEVEGPNPLALSFIDEARQSADLSPREITADEIVDRCMLALANEGGFVLRDGVAARPGDIDVVYVNGYGFPRRRGGPMYYARQLEPDVLRKRIARFSDGRFGYLWRELSPFLTERTGGWEPG